MSLQTHISSIIHNFKQRFPPWNLAVKLTYDDIKSDIENKTVVIFTDRNTNPGFCWILGIK
jgi:hypothetical protein